MKLKKKSLQLFFWLGIFLVSMLLVNPTYGQATETLPWVEDFEFPDNTQSDDGPTSWTAERADALPYWVENGQFVIYDDSDNDPVGTLTTGVIDISGAPSVSVSLDVTRSDGIDDGQDFVKLWAIIDGGDPIVLDSIDGTLYRGVSFEVGEVIQLGNMEISGSTLQLVITGYVSFSTEVYSMDNLSVTENFEWLEDFDLPDGTMVDDGPTAWSAERADGLPFEVRGGRFVINDDNGNDPPGTLTTEVIDISSAGELMITLDVSHAGGIDDGQDYVRLYAIIDGGEQMLLDEVDGTQHKGAGFSEGEVVTLKGTGITGSTLQVVVTAWLSAGAEFYYMDNLKVATQTVTVYNLVTTAEGGSIELDPAGGEYDEGTEVTVTAVPDEGWQFDGWAGDLEGVVEATTTIIMNSDKDITANFSELPTFTLTTNVSNGNIILIPSGGTYPEGTEVTVRAQPFVGSEFVEWTGDLTGTENPTTIVMDADKEITAVIEVIPAFTLTINEAANGSVSANPIKDTYAPGDAVILLATPDEGYRLAEWGGDLEGNENPTGIVMESDVTINPVFEVIPPSYTLTVDAVNGSVTLDPAGGTYEEGTEVTLTADPDDGYIFSEWSGSLTGSDNPVTISMDADKSVTATFSVDVTGIDDLGNAPSRSSLLENYPNPFANVTTIPYQVRKTSQVKLSVFNLMGEQIAVLVNERQAAGYYTVDWNTKDANGNQLENGIYIFRMELDSHSVQVRKAILAR